MKIYCLANSPDRSGKPGEDFVLWLCAVLAAHSRTNDKEETGVELLKSYLS